MRIMKATNLYLPQSDLVELENKKDFETFVGNNAVFEYGEYLHFLTTDKLCFMVKK